MSSLLTEKTNYKMSTENLQFYLDKITTLLQGRVDEAYIFGSTSVGNFTSDSDIDLILIVNATTKPFVQRAFDFIDLFQIYPRLDILVYTQAELEQQLADSKIGFWKSVRQSMKKIL